MNKFDWTWKLLLPENDPKNIEERDTILLGEKGTAFIPDKITPIKSSRIL